MNVRMNEAEKTALKDKAKAAGISASDLFRKAIKRVETWSPGHKETEQEKIRQIARIGNNLNQIARSIHQQGVVNFEKQILQSLLSIESELIKTLREKEY